MDSEEGGAKAYDLHFINVNEGSVQERKLNNHLARSHVAKINRRKKTQLNRQRPNALQIQSLLPKSSGTRVSVSEEETVRNLHSSSEGPASEQFLGGDGLSPAIRENGEHIRTSWDRLDVPATYRNGASQKALLTPTLSFRTISPVMGALSSDTFDRNSEPASARMTDHMLNVMLPRLHIDSQGLLVWFEAFCKHHVVYHALQWAATVHSDLLADRRFWSETRVALTHKVSTIRSIHESLNSISLLRSWDIEMLILGMSVLATTEIKHKHIPDTILVSLFVPHLPTEQWENIFGRMLTSPEHVQAIVLLCERLGGLHKLQFPGLGHNVAYIDLVRACSTFKKPMFPCFWDASPSNIFPGSGAIVPDKSVPGRGFSEIAGGLPTQAVTTFRNLAIVDELMIQYRHPQLTNSNFEDLMNVRNATLYQLMSLPSWDELNEFEKGNSYAAVYEVCRSTAVLYANAVILALPPHSEWHKPVIEHLRRLLEISSLHLWTEDASTLLIWSLFVGGIASYGTPDRKYFERCLRGTLLEGNRISWSAVRQNLKEFLWADSACEHGAAILWDALGFEGTTTS